MWRRVLTRLACYEGDDYAERSKAGMTTDDIVSQFANRKSQTSTVLDTDDSDTSSLELTDDDAENAAIFWRYVAQCDWDTVSRCVFLHVHSRELLFAGICVW